MEPKDYVVIEDIFTETVWLRKIENGPWRKVDLSPFDGMVPVVFAPNVSWCWSETWDHPNAYQI